MLYAGIGSRSSPRDVLEVMQYIGGYLANIGWTLRSGHADGADMAFEMGATEQNGKLEIFLPWDGFNGAKQSATHIVPSFKGQMMDIAATHHPYWHRLSNGAQKLHARNVCQILGANCDAPVDCVICWTPEAKSGGGTGQAIRIANTYGIPVFDLASDVQRNALMEFVNVKMLA